MVLLGGRFLGVHRDASMNGKRVVLEEGAVLWCSMVDYSLISTSAAVQPRR